ncbi:hypothetical protein M4S82_04060 [Planococcus sp. MERTA32b]|nr:hypothetical protein [Planococcus sp. MER TA 32b]
MKYGYRAKLQHADPAILLPAMLMYQKSERKLGWSAKRNDRDLCQDAWNFEKNFKSENFDEFQTKV